MKTTATVLISLAAALFVAAAADAAQIEILPGSAADGRALFTGKGCIACHAMGGEGGTRAPDLASRSVRSYSPGLLASVMWNHGPEMWREMTMTGIPIPEFTSTEAAALFSYFYSELYFSVPGDAARGRRLFTDRNCSRCHGDGASSEIAGPPVSSWDRVRDPISWAERMWNHSERMYARTQAASIPWPELTTEEMVDLLVYFRNLPETESIQAEFEPGDPESGLDVFTRNCEGCHSFGPSLPGRIDLARRRGPATLAGYAAAMWNHAPLMQERAGGALPGLEDGAMSGLVAYLFAQRYFSEPGDVSSGARVFEQKQCIVCHEQDRIATGAPDLTRSTERYSPITMTRALWNHGPGMLEELERRGIDWPLFEGSEMRDLIAWLNSRLVPIVAGGSEP